MRRALLLALPVLLLAGCRKSEGPSPSARGGADSVPANAVVVRMSYGSEKKAFLTEAIAAFHAAGVKTAAGRPIHIDARAEGSAEPLEPILAGQSDLHVWSPASSVLVDVLNARWAERPGALGAGSAVVADAQPLLLTPVVIAMWEPMARALGWPEKKLGWKDLADLAVTEGGWGRFGKPQWGEFKLGHTHPLFSNSGAISLLAATYAGAGKTRDLGLEDVERASAFVKQLESAIVHYGRSTGFFADKMRTRGPEYLSAAVLYENLVVESYVDGKTPGQAFPIVALYPKEGTFWCDNPYAILDVPGVTAEIREAAETFRKFLLAPERQTLAMTKFGYRPADPSIPLSTPLDAAHGLDPREPQNVLPNPPVAVTRRILDSFEEVKKPVCVTFVLDVSGSMKGDALTEAKAGALVFLDSLPAKDQVRVLLFSSQPRWVNTAYEPLTTAREKLKAAIAESFAGGGTALYDSAAAALAPSGNEAPGAIRGVVLLTDGKDTDSRLDLERVVALLRKESGSEEEGAVRKGGLAPPRLFTIAYGKGADPGTLKRMAEAGGGAFYEGTTQNIRSVYAELASFF